MKRKRNYRAEYKRRIASAVKRGFSRAQGRGHPRVKLEGRKKAELSIWATKEKRNEELERVDQIETGDKREFLMMLIEQGKSARDAYTAWFYS